MMICLLAVTLAVDPIAEAELSEAITEPELRAHVARLASPEFLGRSGDGAVRTAEHLERMFRRLPLQPAFGDSYTQPIPSLSGQPKPTGINVGALLPGTDPELRDEWIILSAHYDHLGVKGAALYPGADDNASGVAMLLEVAEQFALAAAKPKRTIVFVSFDLEEVGLIGSTHFAARPPLPFGKLRGFITADIIGRSMAGLMDEYVFLLGSETSPRLRELAADCRPKDLTVGRLGADLVGTRSDYGPFRDRRVPFLFVTTGPHGDYHRPTDLPERLNYAKLHRISEWIADLARRLADGPAPDWNPDAVPADPDEVRTVLELLTRMLDRPEVWPLAPAVRRRVAEARDQARAVHDRGTITPAERAELVRAARAILATAF